MAKIIFSSEYWFRLSDIIYGKSSNTKFILDRHFFSTDDFFKFVKSGKSKLTPYFLKRVSLEDENKFDTILLCTETIQ